MFEMSLPWWEFIVRGAIVFCVLLLMVRVSGRARISVRCIQRAAAEANSRPIKPQPMMPKGILRMA